MPSYSREIKVPGKNAGELYDRVSEATSRLVNRFSIGKVDVQKDPSQKRLNLKSSMFDATLQCKNGSIQCDVRLGMLAAPFRSQIDQGITEWAKKTFGV